MEAKDTVMTRRQQVECSHNPVGELRERDMCEAQAEISFKAGIREVVEWVEENMLVVVRDNLGKTQIDVVIGKAHESEEWQAKLKEWEALAP